MEIRPEVDLEATIRSGQIRRSRVREITILNGFHRVLHQTRKRVTSALLDVDRPHDQSIVPTGNPNPNDASSSVGKSGGIWK